MALAFSHEVVAQDRQVVEVSGGYQYITPVLANQFTHPDAVTYTNGVLAGVAWNATRRIAIVGEFGRSAKTIEVPADAVSVFGSTDQTLYTNAAGIRFWFGRWFVQGLFGQGALVATKTQLLGTLERTTTGTLVQPGVGVNLPVSDRIAARLLADWQYLPSEQGPFRRQLRIGAGVAVGIGARR
jgi:hypothetical protein